MSDPYIHFNCHSVELPATPLAVTQEATFTVRSSGYGEKFKLEYSLPLEGSAAPLSLEFPQGEIVGSEAIMVIVKLRSDKPVSFKAPICFKDPYGNT